MSKLALVVAGLVLSSPLPKRTKPLRSSTEPDEPNPVSCVAALLVAILF